MEIFTNVQLWVAIFMGGAAVKILEYALPSIFQRKEKSLKVSDDERDSLRKDIEYLRGQVDSLRKEVELLREEIATKDREVSAWRNRYWEKRVQLDRVLIQIKHHPDVDMKKKIHDILNTEDIAVIEDGSVE